MRLGSHVAQTEQRIGAQLPLNRREVILGIGISVARGRCGHARLWKKLREVDIRDRICRTSAVGRDLERKGIAETGWQISRRGMDGAIGSGSKGLRKNRRSRAGVAQSVGRLGSSIAAVFPSITE